MADEPTINPYAPPAVDVDAPAAPGVESGAFAKPLFSATQIGWATFFGSVFSGILLLQANYRVMGRSSAANTTIGLGLLATAVIFAVLSLVSRGVSTPINFLLGWGMYRLAMSAQGQEIARHLKARGPRRSGWTVFGVVAATVVVLLGAIMAFEMASGGAD